MKKIYLPFTLNSILFFLLFSFKLSGQYSETFPTANKGILSGCNLTEASCTSDFTGVEWSVNGNFAGMDEEDFISTDGTDLTFSDVDEEMCFESPVLDISAVAGNFSFSVFVLWEGHDMEDYIDVEYQIDGGSWTQVPNVVGGGIHTIDFTTSANSGSTTVNQTGLSGTSTVSIRVCVDINLFDPFEFASIDDLSVPEAGVTVIGDNPTVSISSITSSVSENSSDNLVYRFSRTGDTSGTLPVNFSISGTASDTDFSVSTGGAVTYNSGVGTGTITFPSNDATVDLMVSATGDLTIEADETVVVTILP